MKNLETALLAICWMSLNGCSLNQDKGKADGVPRSFFSDDSYWNTPLGDEVEIDPRSDYWIGLLKDDASGQNFGINLYEYTVPIYEVDSTVTLRKVHQIPDLRNWKLSHSRIFDSIGVPIPDNLEPSPGTDMHVAIVDRQKRLAWDLFLVRTREDGQWESATGMVYALDGPGVFQPDQFPVRDNESIHGYGPGRASGVPVIAGLILYDEVIRGEINHKIAAGCRFVGYKEFVYPPATWTDGNFPGGIPEGAIIQLDPDLDLSRFDLLPGERAIARALQHYGMVLVDFTRGNVLYGEGLWPHPGRSWEGIVRTWHEPGSILSIPLEHYRVLKVKHPVYKGDTIKEYFQKDVREYEERMRKQENT
jgi:hypothetical protein